MKKLLMVAVAAAATTAAPAYANTNSVQISPTATVAAACALNANARSVAGGAGDTQLGYDATTGTSGATSTTSTVNLGLTTAQTLASLNSYCNTGTATLTIASANGYKLVNGSGGANREIAYTVNQPASQTLGFQNGPASSPQSKTLSFILANAVNPLTVFAGTYSDTITVTVTPNV